MVTLEKEEKDFIIKYKKQCETDLIKLIDLKKSKFKGVPSVLKSAMIKNTDTQLNNLEFIIHIFEKLESEF